jgi:hypothetical protein
LPHEAAADRDRLDINGHDPGALEETDTMQHPREPVRGDGIRCCRNEL